MTTADPVPATLPAGKLPHSLLARLLADLPTTDPALWLGPSIGEDAAVIDFAPDHDRLLVAKSDPITFATDQIGYYAVNVCANDLAVTGATPRFFLPTVLLPAGASTGRLAQDIFTQIGAACRAINVVVAGGHSEVTPAVSQPIICGSLLGEVLRTKFVGSGGCRPGDLVLLAGQAPIEGASIIAREMRDHLLDAGWSDTELDQAANYLFDPGISVLRPAVAAAEAGLVTAMHDPTEGGVATGLQEMAIASGTGLELDLDAVPVPDLARRLCVVFDLDPLGTIASGALLATTPPEKVDALIDVWRTLGWQGSVIGRVLPQDEGLRALRAGQTLPFPVFAVDEITKLWKT